MNAWNPFSKMAAGGKNPVGGMFVGKALLERALGLQCAAIAGVFGSGHCRKILERVAGV